MDKLHITAEGYKNLEEELKKLKTIDRPNVIKAIAEAREHGDLSENAEYHAAKERQSFIEGRLADLENKLSRANIIDVSSLTGNIVKFGATLTLSDEETGKKSSYQIVGVEETDVEKGRISISSPLARALVGNTIGDSVEVNTPSGPKNYEIIKIEFI